MRWVTQTSGGMRYPEAAGPKGTDMTATILEFPQAEIDTAERVNLDSTAKQTCDRSAEIIIFPGVRIERRADHETGLPTAKSRKRAKRALHRKS